MEVWPELLTRLVRGVSAAPGAELPPRLCSAFVRLVGLDGAAISLGFSALDRTIACATDSVAELIEDAQDLVRQGPSLDAQRTHTWVPEVTLTRDRATWPLLSQHLDRQELDVTVCAFPMAPHDELLGVLLGYQIDPRPLSLGPAQACFLADAIGVAVVGSLRPEPESTEVRWLARDQIFQATGMVMAQLDLPSADALAVLRAHAFAQHVPLSEVSRDVLARDLDFADENRSGPT